MIQATERSEFGGSKRKTLCIICVTADGLQLVCVGCSVMIAT